MSVFFFHRPSAAIVPAKRSSFYPLLVLALLLSLAVFYAPSFLIISEPPAKADAIVLFPGGQKGTREREADRLLREGFADYLILPATGQIKKRAPDGKLEAFNWKRLEDVSHQQTNEPMNQRNWLVENSHFEVLEAKRLMDTLSLRSALFVSSPYHMRRIKIIAGKVFNNSRAVRYIPTRYETPGEAYWLFSARELELVFTEYAKIFWFFIYSTFSFLAP
jgi:uncharacterized SAM-binding protein YcdF (DUF218 family)